MKIRIRKENKEIKTRKERNKNSLVDTWRRRLYSAFFMDELYCYITEDEKIIYVISDNENSAKECALSKCKSMFGGLVESAADVVKFDCTPTREKIYDLIIGQEY